MNEERFRSLMQGAIGDAAVTPWLAHSVRTRLARPEVRPPRAWWYATVATCVVLSTLAVAIAPRLTHRASPSTPVASASPSASGSPSPLDCSLPVIVHDQKPGPNPAQPWDGGSEAAKIWGFVNTQTGRLTQDPSASPVRGMPVDPVYTSDATPARTQSPPQPALSYSPAAKRWLPVGPERISPDGLSYAYLGNLQWTTLMRYDIETGQSVTLWHAASQITIVRWTAKGILVGSGVPGTSGIWLVDPLTGVPAEMPPPAPPLPPPAAVGSTTGEIGTTASGDAIREEQILKGDTVTIWVWIDTDAGSRVMIYEGSGPAGQMDNVNGTMFYKASGFAPGPAVAEGGEIWFATEAPSLTVWHWDQARGLGQVDISLIDPNVLTVVPAGRCV